MAAPPNISIISLCSHLNRLCYTLAYINIHALQNHACSKLPIQSYRDILTTCRSDGFFFFLFGPVVALLLGVRRPKITEPASAILKTGLLRSVIFTCTFHLSGRYFFFFKQPFRVQKQATLVSKPFRHLLGCTWLGMRSVDLSHRHQSVP